MKIKTAVMLVALFAISSLSFAQDLKQIKSVAALKSFAQGDVWQGGTGINGATILPGGTTWLRAEVPKPDAYQVMMGLVNQRFNFETSDPKNGRFSLQGTLANKQGWALFTDYKETTLVSDGESWYPADSLQFELVSEVPIPIKGVVSGQILRRNGQGQLETERWLNVQDEQVFFPTNSIGGDGQILLGIQGPDGNITGTAYDLSGNHLYSQRVLAGVGMWIKGTYRFEDYGQLNLGPVPEDAVVTVVANQTLTINFNWSSIISEQTGNPPTTFWIRAHGDSKWDPYAWPEKSSTTGVGVGPGTYDVIFDWITVLSEPQQPSSGGGGGGSN